MYVTAQIIIYQKTLPDQRSIKKWENPLIITHSTLHERTMCWRRLAKCRHSDLRAGNPSQDACVVTNTLPPRLWSPRFCLVKMSVVYTWLQTHRLVFDLSLLYGWPRRADRTVCLYPYCVCVYLHVPSGLCLQGSGNIQCLLGSLFTYFLELGSFTEHAARLTANKP